MSEATFVPERETKRTWRFAEVGDLPVLGTIYVQKHILRTLDVDAAAGDELIVTIEKKKKG